MHAGIAWGRTQLELELNEANLVAGQRAPIPPNLTDPAQAMREALEHPLDYPALRRALTPDDQVAIVIDEGIPQLGRLLVPLLEHIGQANVQPDAITLICPTASGSQPWLDDLPDEYQDVHVEIHQPGDRKKLAYLVTTKQGRRVYLNRTAVDAGQLVVLTRRRYDPWLACAGAEMAIFPSLGDQAALDEMRGQLDARPPGLSLWPIQQEARQITWHLGAPYFVQVIDGSDDGIAHVLAGPLESSDAGQRLLDARWRVEFDRPADVVIAGITGTSLDDVARAFLAASRVVATNGSIVVLSEAASAPGPGLEMFRRHDDPALALSMLLQENPSDLTTAFMWATAANQARLYLLSGLTPDVAEELFAIPMQQAEQVQRLLTANAACALLPGADKALAILR